MLACLHGHSYIALTLLPHLVTGLQLCGFQVDADMRVRKWSPPESVVINGLMSADGLLLLCQWISGVSPSEANEDASASQGLTALGPYTTYLRTSITREFMTHESSELSSIRVSGVRLPQHRGQLSNPGGASRAQQEHSNNIN